MFKKFIFFIFLMFFSFFFIHSAKAAYHDFSVVKIETSPSPPVFNELVEVTITVNYKGDEALTTLDGISDYDYSFKNFSFSKEKLPRITGSAPLENDEDFTISISGIFYEKKDTTLSFAINPYGVIYEQSRSNNDIRISSEVIPPYDITVDSIALHPTAPIVDQDVKITVNMKNIGYRDISSGIGLQKFSYDFKNFIEDERTIPKPSLQSPFVKDGVWTYTFKGRFSSVGKKDLVFSINVDNRLDESNFNNNSNESSITVGSLDSLDFEVQDLEISKEAQEIIVGDSIIITAKIKNNSEFSISSGDGLLERDYRFASGGDYEFIFDNFEIESVNHDSYPTIDNTFDPDEYFTYTFNGRAKNAGSGLVSFRIDIRDKLKEKNESNNLVTLPYVIYSSQEELDSFGVLKNEVKYISSSSVKICWLTDKITDGYIMMKNNKYNIFDRYLLASGLEDWPSANETKDHQIRLDNLKLGETYRYIIKNTKNGIKDETHLKEFKMPSKDEFSIQGIPQAIVDEDGKVKISWKSDWLTKSRVYYKLKTGGIYMDKTLDVLTDDHEVNIGGLEDGEYYYYVSSISEGGTEKSSDIYTFQIGIIDEQKEGDDLIDDKKDKKEEANKEREQNKDEDSDSEVKNKVMYNNLKGKIILKVELNGEAYYVNPQKETIHYLGRPKDAFKVMREQGIGINDQDLYKIPIGIGKFSGDDSDGDGLSDLMENALNLDKNNVDSDGDGYSDKDEILSGFSPWMKGIKLNIDYVFSNSQKGKIFLQVEQNGEAWYVNPGDGKRYFLGRPEDAFNVMRDLGLGISNDNFDNL